MSHTFCKPVGYLSKACRRGSRVSIERKKTSPRPITLLPMFHLVFAVPCVHVPCRAVCRLRRMVEVPTGWLCMTNKDSKWEIGAPSSRTLVPLPLAAFAFAVAGKPKNLGGTTNPGRKPAGTSPTRRGQGSGGCIGLGLRASTLCDKSRDLLVPSSARIFTSA
jgi:hypothetical protein